MSNVRFGFEFAVGFFGCLGILWISARVLWFVIVGFVRWQNPLRAALKEYADAIDKGKP